MRSPAARKRSPPRQQQSLRITFEATVLAMRPSPRAGSVRSYIISSVTPQELAEIATFGIVESQLDEKARATYSMRGSEGHVSAEYTLPHTTTNADNDYLDLQLAMFTETAADTYLEGHYSDDFEAVFEFGQIRCWRGDEVVRYRCTGAYWTALGRDLYGKLTARLTRFPRCFPKFDYGACLGGLGHSDALAEITVLAGVCKHIFPKRPMREWVVPLSICDDIVLVYVQRTGKLMRVHIDTFAPPEFTTLRPRRY